MKKRREKERIPLGDASEPLRAPLLDVAALRRGGEGAAPPEPSPAPPEAKPTGSAAEQGPRSVYARAPRLVVRRERKGHGGKTWTRIEGLTGSTVEIEAALRELKRALGCGAVRDGADVVVQGAPGERLVAFLEARGARKVVVGS